MKRRTIGAYTITLRRDHIVKVVNRDTGYECTYEPGGEAAYQSACVLAEQVNQ